jgi:nucleoside-diphosphate-sugar epimerase
MLRLLLIGHGYLGTQIAHIFRHAGWKVTAASHSGMDGTLRCDVGNAESVATLPSADLIIHCAASGRGGPDAYRNVYVNGCSNLTQQFPHTPLIFTSSTSVYAQTDGSVVDESSATLPDRETGHLLLQAESITQTAGGIIARLSGIYGPNRSIILKKFLLGEAIIEEDGERYLNQIHRDDAANALLHLATHGAKGHVYNVSDSHPLTQIDCYLGLAEQFQLPLPPRGPRDLNRKRGWTHKKVSSAKLIHLGWKPKYASFLDAAKSISSTL